MKISLNQQELNQVIQDHLTSQGICLNGKDINFDYADGVEITLGQVSKPKRKPKETKPVETTETVELQPTEEVEEQTEDLPVEPETTEEETQEDDDDLPFQKPSRPLFT